MHKKKLFRNSTIDKKQLKQILSSIFNEFGIIKAAYFADQLKFIGFKHATQAGISISIEDLKVPAIKTLLINNATKKVYDAEFDVNVAKITEVERFQKVINTWNTTSDTLKDEVVSYFRKTDPLNSIYMMAFSGARGNLSQVRQLVGMRGLMSDPNGQIIDLPIIENFREGLTVTDYIISSYGARKGLVDTALRTADSGYLTRRLIDVAQDVITREKDCKTKQGIYLLNIREGQKIIVSLKERGLGRLLASDLKDLKTNRLIAKTNDQITINVAKKIDKYQFDKIIVRSPLTCVSSRSVCQSCYGWNLAYGNLIDLGEGIGIIAAQSIGEPGTQLTMRTFHTGGVFTTEPSRQVKAEFSGKIEFANSLKIQLTRTQYGDNAFISENESCLNLVSYTNERIVIPIIPETLILINNNAYVKKNDIILELPSQTRKTGEEQVFKDIYINSSGEVQLQNVETQYLKESKLIKPFFSRTNLAENVWVLSGQVFAIPSRAKLNVKSKQFIREQQMLAQTVRTSSTGGIINLQNSNKYDFETVVKILHYCKIINKLKIWYSKHKKNKHPNFVLYGRNERKVKLFASTKANLFKAENNTIGIIENRKYKTKTGGLFYYIDCLKRTPEHLIEINTIRVGGTLFYIPQFSYDINCEEKNLLVQRGDVIKYKTEVSPNFFVHAAGIVDLQKTKKAVKTIIIKPGYSIKLVMTKGIKAYHEQIFYPGEVIFDDFLISRLSYSEIKKIDSQYYLWIYPIIRYEIVRSTKDLDYVFDPKKISNDINLGDIDLKFEYRLKIKTHQPFQLVSQPVICSAVTNNLVGESKLIYSDTLDQFLQLRLLIVQRIVIDKSPQNNLSRYESDCSIIVRSKQFVEPSSILSISKILNQDKTYIVGLKQQEVEKDKKILLNRNVDYHYIYFNKPINNLSLGQLIRKGDSLGNGIKAEFSGIIQSILKQKITIQIAQPVLFSHTFRIEKRIGDLVNQGQSIGKLVYERARTGDIVQGLPRVEEILEARKPKTQSVLVQNPGFIKQLVHFNALKTIIISPIKDLKYIIKGNQRLLVGEDEFVKVGQPLNDASINPHNLLEVYFYYFLSFSVFSTLNFSTFRAAYQSLRKVQSFLLNSVQSVYYSQGVTIADKHVEIIIKQMTSKVQILSGGASSLLQDEIIELEQVQYINSCLPDESKIFYQPILLGITKASLKTDSFISAASFQYTTRILTEAAIQGKIDWLRGLKENVIIGRLIPTGTGLNAYIDISYLYVKILPNEKKKKKSGLLTTKEKQKKYIKLKKKVIELQNENLTA